MTKVAALALAVLTLALAACGGGGDQLGSLAPANGLPDAPRLVAEADWSAPELVTVVLADHAFRPDALVFHRDHPTRLVLQNTTDSDHTFVSTGFFQSIAVAQLVSNGTSTAGPYVESVSLPAGQTKEMWFIPARYGAWTFSCEILGHALRGETGTVNVVR